MQGMSTAWDTHKKRMQPDLVRNMKTEMLKQCRGTYAWLFAMSGISMFPRCIRKKK